MMVVSEVVKSVDSTLENEIDSKTIEGEVCPICLTPLGVNNKTFSLKVMSISICYKCQLKEFMEELATEKRMKIKLHGVHFGWINERLLSLFDRSGIKNRTAWIINAAKEDFGINLLDKESIERFDVVVRVHHYIDKNDWLRDRIRHEVEKTEELI
jgi:hypothetical protein